MTAGDARLLVAQVLDEIPTADEGPASLQELCQQAGFDDPGMVGRAILGLLQTFGVLRVLDEHAPDALLVKADSPAASLFLRSLAEHVRTEQPMLSNWARHGISEAPYTEREVLRGPQFLYLIEHQRLAVDPEAHPLRRVRVAQVLIKARMAGRGDQYLVLHDDKAKQYQLPGGRHRPGDATMHETAARELAEELPKFAFDSNRDSLVELGSVDVAQLSRTFGVSTAYEMTFFHFRSTRTILSIGPGGRWIGESKLLGGNATVGGQTLNMAGLRQFTENLPGGIMSLAASLPLAQRRSVLTVLRDRPWEAAGVVLGVLGIVVSIILYLLT